ncbi:unnamed protein product [Rotaria sp. Silwood2]|nr:unnamed protein product [Rotaria sp. Silwood2]
MTTSVSVRPPTGQLHQSLSADEQDQYYGTINDDTLCMEYLNEITTDHQSQSKDGVYRVQNDQQAIPARSSSSATKPGISPYLQKLPHSNFLQVMLPRPSSSSTQQRRQRRRRRRSTSTGRTREELLDSAYQPTNVDHLDLSSFFANSNNSFNRPTSAPTRTMPSSAKKKRTGTSIHKTSSKGQTCIITIYRNGDHDKSCYCKANSLNAILQYATEKLHMSSAARRLFDTNGQEIYRVEDIQANQEYYVSGGENFKDPFKSIRVQTEYSLNSTWTMKGLQTDAVKPKSFTTKTVISKRLDKQIKTSISLTIIENGFGSNDAIYHMLIDTVLKENFEKFLEECTKKLELTAHARKVFNYRGDEMKSLKLFLESDECTIKTVHDENVIGPIWISKGERFRPTGAYIYLELRYKEFQLQYKNVKKHYRDIMIVIKTRKQRTMKENDKNETSEDEQFSSTEGTDKEQNKTNDKSSIKDKSLLSMSNKELKEAKQALEDKLKEIEDLMKLYKAKMAEIEAAKDEEKELGPKFPNDHIAEFDFHHKMVGRHPLCLIIHENGSFNSFDPTIYLNLRSLPSKSTLQTSIEYLLQYLQTSIEMFARQRPKRVFDVNGNEIKVIGQLKSKQHLFISYGEDYRPAFVLPDDFSIHMSAFHSDELYHEHIGYWSDVYGFEMNTVAKNILVDGHVIIVPANDIMTSDCCIKTLDIYTCSNDDITFTHPFTVEVLKSGSISGFVCHFDVNFAKNLIEKVHFSTSPRSPKTHWKQTVFFLPRLYSVQEGEEITGKISCQRHPNEKRGLVIHLYVFDSKFKFYLE